MKRKMYFRMITASLIRRRSRMLVALLAIAIGATILCGLITIYYDVPRQMGAEFRNYGANMLFVASGEDFSQSDIDDGICLIPEDEVVGVAPYRYETVRINSTPVLAAATDMEGAEKTSPYWSVDGEWPAGDGEIMVGATVADTYGIKQGEDVTITFAPDTEEGNALVSEDYSYEDSDEVSDEEEIVFDNEITLKCSAILETGGSEEDYLYMTLGDMETLTGDDTTYDLAEVSVSSDSEQLSAYAKEISDSVPAIDARLIKRVTASETTVLGKLQSLVLLVTIVVLALTMICVATTMMAVVVERRREIGLKKALGATNTEIIWEFMGENILLGALGGLLGAGLGFLFAQEVSINVFSSSIVFRPLLIPISVLSSVAVTAIACILPIRSATLIDPALVLKGE